MQIKWPWNALTFKPHAGELNYASAGSGISKAGRHRVCMFGFRSHNR